MISTIKKILLFCLFLSFFLNSYSAQNITSCGNIYTSTDNYFLNDTLNCEGASSGIVFRSGSAGSTLDCQGNKIINMQNSGFNIAIEVDNVDDITISNCNIINSSVSLWIKGTDSSTIENIFINSSELTPLFENGSLNNLIDFYLEDTSTSTFENITFNSFSFGNSFGYQYCENTFTNLKDFNGKYHHFINTTQIIDGWTNISSLTLCGTSNSEIRNLDLTSIASGSGINLNLNENVLIEDTTISNFYNGIYGYNNKNITINRLSSNNNFLMGIQFFIGSNNNLNEVETSNNKYGIYFSSMNGTNIFEKITATNNQNYGIYFGSHVFPTLNFELSESTITSNGEYNLYFDSLFITPSATIYNNTLGNISKIYSENWDESTIDFSYLGYGNTYYNATTYNGSYCFGVDDCDTNATISSFPIIPTAVVNTGSSVLPFQSSYSMIISIFLLIIFSLS